MLWLIVYLLCDGLNLAVLPFYTMKWERKKKSQMILIDTFALCKDCQIYIYISKMMYPEKFASFKKLKKKKKSNFLIIWSTFMANGT
jgi:hypothetical protein